MKLKKFLCIGLLASTTCTVAIQAIQTNVAGEQQDAGPIGGQYEHDRQDQRKQQDDPTSYSVGLNGNPLVAPPQLGLQVREPRDKRFVSIAKPSAHRDRLIVKFGDPLRVRPKQDGRVSSVSPLATDRINAIEEQFGVQFKQAIRTSSQKVEAMLSEAATHSGRMQPDLLGMMHVVGPENALEQAIVALHELEVVEWVKWDNERILHGGKGGGAGAGGGGDLGACCTGNGVCFDVTEEDCTILGGNFQGVGTTCPNDGLCGGCCFGQACEYHLADNCADEGGTYTADGVACESACEIGACCTGGAACSEVTGFECVVSLGGVFRNGGSTCDTEICDDTPGACCLPQFDYAAPCISMPYEECLANNGAFFGPGEPCIVNDEDVCEDLEVACGPEAEPFGNCFDPDGTFSPFCQDTAFGACCDLVCQIDEFCCDEDVGVWDEFCSYLALELPPPCANNPPCTGSPFSYDCYNAGGCSTSWCCAAVAAVNPFCAMVWTEDCADIALVECGLFEAPTWYEETPDFEPYQAWRTAAAYSLPFFPPPPLLRAYTPTIRIPLLGLEVIVDGFNMQGLNLNVPGEPFEDENGNGWWDEMEPFEDENGNETWDPGEPFEDLNGNGTWDDSEPWTDWNGDNIWQRPGGLHGLSEQLLFQYGINALDLEDEDVLNLTKGHTGKIGIIEWGIYPDHEDLNFNVEDGQTVITIPEITEPEHGTATMGIVNAQDNGFGVTGVVPEAEAWFFPLTSVEEGERELTAWVNAIEQFGPGDVISASYGPGNGNLDTEEEMNTLFRIASDLGIIVCVSAGNDCTDLSGMGIGDEDGEGSGALVITGCTPGAIPGIGFYRWANTTGGSSYTSAADDVPTTVHASGWMSRVTTTGYGDLFAPDPGDGSGPDPDRSYSLTFGGTSAASPMVAGAVAAIQGLSKQIYGIPLTTDQIQVAFGMGPAVPTAVGRAAKNGGFTATGANSCWLDVDPDAGPNFIGPFPDLAGDFDSAASNLLNNVGEVFSESPLIHGLHILKGELVYGNIFSIRADDSNLLVLRSETAGSGSSPDSGGTPGGGGGPVIEDALGQAEYFGKGQVTDVVVEAHAEVPAPTFLTIDVDMIAPQAPGGVIHFLQLYNWQEGQWDFIAFNYVQGPVFLDNVAPLFSPELYVNADEDNLVLIRSWTYGFGNEGTGAPGGAAGTYLMRYDIINPDHGGLFGGGGDGDDTFGG